MRLLEKLAKAKKEQETDPTTTALLGAGAGAGIGLGLSKALPSAATAGPKSFADMAPDIARLSNANKIEELFLRHGLKKLDQKPGAALSLLKKMRGTL